MHNTLLRNHTQNTQQCFIKKILINSTTNYIWKPCTMPALYQIQI